MIKYEIRKGAYYDSVVLMKLQKSLTALPGVIDAGVVMATPANREVLLSTGFSLETVQAKADDLLIVVKSDAEREAAAALAQVDALLKERSHTDRQEIRLRSLSAAAKNLPTANWVLISIPGRYAAEVADEALDLGKHVFLYSDNVPIEDELKLKLKARDKGLMVMGPDCGTAIINGIGLGFANRVRRGKIGIVAASGTGLQSVSAHIHNLGGGISQAIGTGGRDLKEEIEGITAFQGLDLLSRDPESEAIILISKPPSAHIATKLITTAQATMKPTVIHFIGYPPPPARRLGNLYFATSLNEAAEISYRLLVNSYSLLVNRDPQSPLFNMQSLTYDSVAPTTGYLRGLFSGGTLAYETMLGLQTLLYPLHTNVSIHPGQQMADVWHSEGHTIIDLGEDSFTQGRLHPMMDNDLRIRRLRHEGADPDVHIILLDMVLGEGAHMDPAGEFSPVIQELIQRRPELKIVTLVIGTDEDPQDINQQILTLEQAGSAVFRKMNNALSYISQALCIPIANPHPPLPLDHFVDGLDAINVGLDTFYNSLKSQGAGAIQVDWRPPAGGNEKLMAILAKMKKKGNL